MSGRNSMRRAFGGGICFSSFHDLEVCKALFSIFYQVSSLFGFLPHSPTLKNLLLKEVFLPPLGQKFTRLLTPTASPSTPLIKTFPHKPQLKAQCKTVWEKFNFNCLQKSKFMQLTMHVNKDIFWKHFTAKTGQINAKQRQQNWFLITYI